MYIGFYEKADVSEGNIHTKQRSATIFGELAKNENTVQMRVYF